MHVKCLQQRLTHSMCSRNITIFYYYGTDNQLPSSEGSEYTEWLAEGNRSRSTHTFLTHTGNSNSLTQTLWDLTPLNDCMSSFHKQMSVALNLRQSSK